MNRPAVRVKNFDLSRKAHDAIRPKRGQCQNTALLTMGEVGADEYVEGTILFQGKEVAHAWVLLDGEIIDAQLPAFDGPYLASKFAHYEIVAQWIDAAKDGLVRTFP